MQTPDRDTSLAIVAAVVPITQAAQFLQLSELTLRKALKRGDLAGFLQPTGNGTQRRLMITVASMLAWNQRRADAYIAKMMAKSLADTAT